MPQCLKSKILRQTNPECNFLSHSGLKTAAVQKLLRLSFTYPAAGEGAYVGWAEAAISLSLPSHHAQALRTVLLLPEKRKRQPRNVIGQDKPEKKNLQSDLRGKTYGKPKPEQLWFVGEIRPVRVPACLQLRGLSPVSGNRMGGKQEEPLFM